MTNNGSWQKVRFDQICKNISDRIDDPKQAKTDYYVGLEHLDSEDPKISRHGSPQDVSKTKLLFYSGQILFGKRNWYLRRLAVAERDGICSAHMLVLESIKGKTIKEFVPLLMFSDDFYEKAIMVSAGSMSPTIKWKDISKLEFLIPSISEQKTILSIIQKIDNTISNAQKLLEKTKNYAISRRESLLTRGIGHKKFKKVDFHFGNIIEIPEKWDVGQLKEYVLKIGSGVTPKGGSSIYLQTGIPLIRSQNVHFEGLSLDNVAFISEKIHDDMKNSKLKDNDVLLNITGASIGRCTYVPANFGEGNVNQHVCIIRTKPILLHTFLSYRLSSYLLQNIIQSSQVGLSREGLNFKEIGNFVFSLPPLSEQQKIATILSNIDKQINQQQSHLTNLKILRKSILNSKLTKEKIVVTN